MITGPQTIVAAPVPEGRAARGPTRSLWSGRRSYVAVMLFFNLFINYMDRINLSVAAPTIAREFGWDAAKMGILFSSYQWTYLVFLLLWGYLADRFGTRIVNGVSVSFWSLAAMLTGAATGFGSMLTARLALGVGEAASFPTSGKVVRQWFPASERGLATAIFNAGSFAGPAFSAPLVAWLLLAVGWRQSFMITGGVGLIWVAVWLAFFRVPSECGWLPADERRYILEHSDAPTVATKPPPRALLRLISRKTMWGLLLTQGCCAYTMLLFLFWLPSYLVQSRHMSLTKAGWFTAVPYLVAAVLGTLIGRLSDSLLTPDAIRHGKRRTLLIGFILASTIVLSTNAVTSDAALLFLVSVSLTCISSALALNIAMTNDLVWNPNMVGTALGLSIMGGNIFGSLVPIVTGYIVKATGSFDLAFYIAGGLLFAAALICYTMTRTPLNFEESTDVL
jgi:sugar phosphate permease